MHWGTLKKMLFFIPKKFFIPHSFYPDPRFRWVFSTARVSCITILTNKIKNEGGKPLIVNIGSYYKLQRVSSKEKGKNEVRLDDKVPCLARIRTLRAVQILSTEIKQEADAPKQL